MCADHAIDWQVGFEWTQLSSSEFISGEHYDYFTIQFSVYSEQELQIRPYTQVKLDLGTEVDYSGEVQVSFDQFKAQVFAQLKFWKGVIICPNAGYRLKDIIFKVIFQQSLDDCYKILINNLTDLSTLWEGWPMDSCEFGTDAEVTFFEWTPVDYIGTDIADEYQYWVEADDADRSSDTCWNVPGSLGLSPDNMMVGLYDLGLEMVAMNQ